jgi:hypothetical protein
MSPRRSPHQKYLEIFLIVISVALCVLLDRVGDYRMVVLNLFYLPVVLAAFFLGRYSAGILALLCVMCASVVTALNLNTFAGYSSPLAIGLSLTIWGAVMGINAILVGTLSDESAKKIEELHDAYLGVVEVLVRYLNSADPKLKDQAIKISRLGQRVATRMKLSDTEIDNIRVAALLQDIESIEVTARVIQRAVGDLVHGNKKNQMENTFNGRDLVQSLGSVLTGALPLLVDKKDCLNMQDADDEVSSSVEQSLEMEVLHTVRRYLKLLSQNTPVMNPRQAIAALKSDLESDHHPAVMVALEQEAIHFAETECADDLMEFAMMENH